VRSLLIASALLWGLAPLASAQPAGQSQLAAEVKSLVDTGVRLEIQRRWGEAFTHYEEALREYPGVHDLEHRLQLAKLHYELGRRYHDASFRSSLNIPEQDAVAVYQEVLLKVQSHYVDQPNWKQLVDYGTSSFTVALDDEVFLDEHLPGVPEARIRQFRRELETRMGGYLIRNRTEARDAVAWAARFAGEQLGLAPAPVILEYLCGTINLMDDYSSYLTADQLNEVYSQIEGNFVGLGIELKASQGALQILRVIPGSPAERSGLRSGDTIVAVDGRATSDMNSDQAANLLQGKEGTTVDVTLASPGQSRRTVRVRREHVEVPSVDEVKIVDRDFGVGYLRLTCFQKTTSRDLDAALWKLHRDGMRSLIIDLRGNPGGLLSSSVEVVDKFVTTGGIVSTKGRSPQEDFNYSARVPGTWRVPLVVLIDGDSASASEIFAGAIRDHNRGRIVGSRSYGKGSVQGIFPLSTAGAGLRLTTAKFYSPKGKPFTKVGVSPDVKVQVAAKPIDDGVAPPQLDLANDAVLNAGLQEARNLVARR
jgi:carboxyl-terminal processing protease